MFSTISYELQSYRPTTNTTRVWGVQVKQISLSWEKAGSSHFF